MPEFRAGIGYDVHSLVAGRPLVLGGVTIPHTKGLDGWSDADVLTHAVMDALLGAAALGDIGSHFPPGEAQYQNISSLVLLGKVREKLARKGWRAGNIDVTVAAEEPKLSGYMPQMKDNIGQALRISMEQVSIKATTSEHLGFVGRGEGIAAWAVATIEGASSKLKAQRSKP